MAPEYKLNYFDLRGYGETARLIFHYAGVPFEDRRFTHEEWPTIKPGLSGKDDWEAAQVDALSDAYKDFGNTARPYFMVLFGREQGDKEALYKDFAKAFDEMAKHLKKYLKDAGNGFLFAGGLTWADFFTSEFHDTLNGFNPEIFKDHPELLRHSEKVHSLPQLQDYLKNRPKTQN
uniref:glutathione transferase n=1 Tax=Acrobeloides nanus TaxID=290746 RepID=A0A914E1R2_9BILA